MTLILMLRGRCYNCERVWLGTEEAMRKWPHCPFCGANAWVEEAT